MALPASGVISVSAINVEQGNSSNRQVSYLTLAQEWYANTGKAKFNITTNISLSLWYSESWVTGSAPAAPSGVSFSYDSLNLKYNLSWTDNSTDETGFHIIVSVNGGGFTDVADVGAGVISYQDFTDYEGSIQYGVRANGATNHSVYAYSPIIATPTAAPTGVTATYDEATQDITINWTDNDPNETNHRMEVSIDGGAFAVLDNTANSPKPTIHVADSYIEGTTFDYRVRSYDSYGVSTWAYSSRVIKGSIPDAPIDASATSFGASLITVDWVDVSSNEDNFKITRSVNGSAFDHVFTSGPNITAWDDTLVSAGNNYTYRVSAINEIGESAYDQTNTVQL